jgi:hypothetical protein
MGFFNVYLITVPRMVLYRLFVHVVLDVHSYLVELIPTKE